MGNHNPYIITSELYLQGTILTLSCPFVEWCFIKEPMPKLLGRFILSDTIWTSKYQFVFEYFGGCNLKTWIVSPDIPSNPDIHYSRVTGLCLFFPSDFNKSKPLLLARDVVAKCRTWVDNYELWCINGNKWLGNERKHGEAEDMLSYYYMKTGRLDLFK